MIDAVEQSVKQAIHQESEDSGEMDDLRKQLKEKDAEIERLRQKLDEKDTEIESLRVIFVTSISPISTITRASEALCMIPRFVPIRCCATLRRRRIKILADADAEARGRLTRSRRRSTAESTTASSATRRSRRNLRTSWTR
jgi:predicted RNase H-like nuclease (RuvC/YqgF family)